MKHFTNKELIEFIPTDSIVWEDSRILNSKKTQALLGAFILYSGLEEYKVNGSFYRSNTDLMEDIETTSDSTVIAAINKLVGGGYINREVGTRQGKKASIYSVNLDLIYTKRTTPLDYSSSPMTTPVSDWSSKLLEQNEAILLELRKMNEFLATLSSRTTSMNYSTTSHPDRSTDIESDKDKDKDKEIEIDKIGYINNNINDFKNNRIVNNINPIDERTSTTKDPNHTPIQNNDTSTEELETLSSEEVIDLLNYRSLLKNVKTDFDDVNDLGKIFTAAQRTLEAMRLPKSVKEEVIQAIEADNIKAIEEWNSLGAVDNQFNIEYEDEIDRKYVDGLARFFYERWLEPKHFDYVEQVDDALQQMRTIIFMDAKGQEKRGKEWGKDANKIHLRVCELMSSRRAAMKAKKDRAYAKNR